MAFDLSSATEETHKSGFDLSSAKEDSSLSDKKESTISNTILRGISDTIASKGVDPMMASNPIMSIAEKIAQASYSKAKNSLFESPIVKEFNNRFSDQQGTSKNPVNIALTPVDAGAKLSFDVMNKLSNRDVAKAVENLGVDIAAFSIAGSGVRVNQLTKDFVKNKAFASNNQLMDDLFNISNKVLKETAMVMQKKSSNEAVKETARVVSKANNPIEVKIKLEGTLKRIFDERNSLISQYNSVLPSRHTASLEKYLNSELALKEMTETQRTAAFKLLDEAKAEINSFGGSIDRITAQKLKEKYQDLALYEKSEDALIKGTAKAARKIANELKGMVVDGLPKNVANKIQSINDRYYGIMESIDIFDSLGQQFKVNPSKFSSGVRNYFTQVVGRKSVGDMVTAAIRFSPKIVGHGSFKGSTAKIESLKNEYMATRSILENRLKSADIPVEQKILMSNAIDKKLLGTTIYDKKLLPAPEKTPTMLSIEDRSKEFTMSRGVEEQNRINYVQSLIKETGRKAMLESKNKQDKLRYVKVKTK